MDNNSPNYKVTFCENKAGINSPSIFTSVSGHVIQSSHENYALQFDSSLAPHNWKPWSATTGIGMDISSTDISLLHGSVHDYVIGPCAKAALDVFQSNGRRLLAPTLTAVPAQTHRRQKRCARCGSLVSSRAVVVNE